MERLGGLDEAMAAAMEAAPDAMVLFETKGTIVYANAACATVLGHDPDQLIGSNLGALVHPDDMASTTASMRSFKGEGAKGRVPSTVRLRRGDGTYGTIDMNGNPFTTPDGRRLNLLVGRRAELFQLMTAALDELSGVPDVESILSLLPEMLRLRVNMTFASVVWRTEDGETRVFGDELPPEMIGQVVDERDDTSPFVLAWQGKELSGGLEDLPSAIVPMAEERDVTAWWLMPIEGTDRVTHALVALWEPVVSHNEPEARRRIRALTNIARVSLQFSQHHDKLVYEARHDPLTGLLNRRTFHDALTEHELDTTTTAVLFIDLDDFKPVNDQYGHEAGDVLLVEVARRLERVCRAGDVVCRLGGDEFSVLCPDCTEDEARAIARAFLEALHEPIDVGEASVVVQASVGLALGHAQHADDLARAADRALYRAKDAGGDAVEVAPPVS